MTLRAFDVDTEDRPQPTTHPFMGRLIVAAQQAILLGVKWSLVLLIVLFVGRELLTLREQAQNGQNAATALSLYIQAGTLPSPQAVQAALAQRTQQQNQPPAQPAPSPPSAPK